MMEGGISKLDRSVAEDFLLVERRRRAYQLHWLGWTFERIAVELGISSSTAHRDVIWCERFGAEVIAADRRDLFNKVWSDYEVLLREALGAWVRSQAPARTTSRKVVDGGGPDGDGSREETTEQEKTGAGDPRFLAIAEQCLAKQALLAGLITDAKKGSPTVLRQEDDADEGETIVVIEVRSRDEVATLEGKRYCRIAGPVEGEAAQDGASAAEATMGEDGGGPVATDAGDGTK